MKLEIEPLGREHILNYQLKKVEKMLYPHQVTTIEYMRYRETSTEDLKGICGGIIHLSAGLGKTLISVYHSITDRLAKIENGDDVYPTLIVVSKTMMREWQNECFEKFFKDTIKVLVFYDSYKKLQKITRKEIMEYDFVITTYDECSKICNFGEHHKYSIVKKGEGTLLQSDKIDYIKCKSFSDCNKIYVKGPNTMYCTPWERIICDESHRFANPNSKIFTHMMSLYGKHKWCMSGTPMTNYSTDIWSQLRFCGYEEIKTQCVWKKKCDDIMKGTSIKKAIISIDHEKTDVELPSKTSENIYIDLSDDEKKCYEWLLGLTKLSYNEMLRGKKNYMDVLTLFTRLRQCCISPKVLQSQSFLETIKKDCSSDAEYVRQYDSISTRYKTIKDIASKIPSNEKVLIFTMYATVAEHIGKLLGSSYIVITGKESVSKRENMIKEFRTSHNVKGLIFTYKVGSEGLNLTEANHVINVEPWWNNTVSIQSESRAWRIGQKKEVHVYNIYVNNSIEIYVQSVKEKKQDMINSFLSLSSKIKLKKNISKKKMGKILGII